MDYSVTPDHRQIEEQVGRICSRFSDDFWLQIDDSGRFPEEFYRAIAGAGWLGIAMPVAHGGAGLGITEAAIMMRTIAESGAGMTGASSIHMNIFGLQPVVVFGTEQQKSRMLPPLIKGDERACFAVTEADAGLNTAEIRTKAARRGDVYVLSGSKIWISTAQVSDRVLILARTTPVDAVARKTGGLSLFYTALDRARVEIRPIRKMGRHGVDLNMLFFQDWEVPADDLIGNEGEGFRHILHSLNPERVLIAAEAIGLGRAALRKATQYAKERVVFGRPIGKNQAIAHPLAVTWMNLEAADLMVMKAAYLYDTGAECGAAAGAAKYLAAEAAHAACQTAVMTLGGMGYSREFHVERYLRESFIPRIAPITPHMILNYIAEKVLGLPKSY